ncbi:hypothetical protein EUGRSUZ_K00475 [Eucalyptus grandis]|uniref:Uncharacterized protein n=2 Tax=Eucalyptus grandis TaxID=71139 RepID=A0A058ZXZ0_EUCGR|nr:hypothetical protein EUGRSUZ_K00475 [Eucalyptus grandis]
MDGSTPGTGTGPIFTGSGSVPFFFLIGQSNSPSFFTSKGFLCVARVLERRRRSSRWRRPEIMVGFKNRYMVMEVFLDPNRELGVDDPIILTQFNVSKAIRDSILVNFGECGLASSLGSFQVKYVNPITKLCIIRASREEHQKVWAAITLVTSVGSCPVLFNLLDLSASRPVKKLP